MAADVIIMAILGCGDAGAACQTVAISPVRYESVSACVAAQEDALARSDVMFPVVTAQCRPLGSAEAARLDRPRAKSPRRPLLRQASLSG